MPFLVLAMAEAAALFEALRVLTEQVKAPKADWSKRKRRLGT